MGDIKSLTYDSGHLIVDNGSGPPRQIPIASIIRGADIPEMTSAEAVDASPVLTQLAQVVSALIQTLIENETIGEDWAEGYDLDYAAEILVDELEAEYGGHNV